MNSSINEQLPSLRKPNEILVMISKEKGLSAMARKLYTVLLWETQQQMKALGRMPEVTHLFELPLKRALMLAGSSTESRTSAQLYLREMRKQSITWEAPGTINGHEWTDMALLSQATFYMKNGERYVQWSLPPNLFTALMDPNLWTLQDLPILASLESYAAIALYDICSRYKNNPSGVTNRAAPDWWVNALSSAAKKREWRKVKNESVAHAVQEINEKTDIHVELLEHRQGRAVTEIQFSVKKKNAVVPPPQDDPAQRVGPRLISEAKELDISVNQLNTLIKKYSEEQLVDALRNLRNRIDMQWAPPIRNQYMYLMSHLESSAPNPIAPPEVVRRDIEVQTDRVRQIAAAQEIEAETQAKKQQRFDDTVARLVAMPLDMRNALLQELALDLKERGMFTPSMARRFRDGDWTSPLLKVELVKWVEAKDAGNV